MSQIEKLVNKQLKTLQVPPTSILMSEEYQKIKTQADQAEKAGFTTRAEKLRSQLETSDNIDKLTDIMEKTGYKIILNRPRFEHMNSVVLKKAMWPNKADKDLVLCEISPSMYSDEVPQFAVEAVIKAKEAGLTPMLWTVTERAQAERILDPVVVGYLMPNQPLIGVDPAAELMHNRRSLLWGMSDLYTSMFGPRMPDHCLLIAAWGKDLEAINSYFEKSTE